jgi:hypothetical protein
MFNGWHFEMQRVGTRYHFLTTATAGKSIWYLTSEDGTHFDFVSKSPAVALSGTGWDTFGYYKPAGLPLPGEPLRWDLVIGSWTPISAPTNSSLFWKLLLYRGVELPMNHAEIQAGVSNTWQAAVVPPASVLSPATNATPWKGLSNTFIGNRFSVFTPTPVRYVNCAYSGNTGRVAVAVVRLFGPQHSIGRIVSSVSSTKTAGGRFDLGTSVLTAGDYVLGFWSDNEGSSLYYGRGASSIIPGRLAFGASYAVWPPPGETLHLTPTSFHLLGVTLDGDY